MTLNFWLGRYARRALSAVAILVAVPSLVMAQLSGAPGTEVPRPLWTALPGSPLVHGDHARYSIYLIDPQFTHHAILEDELRLNFFFDDRENGGQQFRTSLELAWALSDAFGFEVFLPFIRTKVGNQSSSGIGDVEFQPLKWSFLRSTNLVATAVLATVIPLGDEEAGLGDGLWAIEPHLFVDAVVGTVAIQTNLGYGFIEGGAEEFGFSLSVARIVFLGENTAVGPSLEFMGELATNGNEAGSLEALGLAPGAKLELGRWYFGAGLRLPLVEEESKRLFVFSGGYHVSF